MPPDPLKKRGLRPRVITSLSHHLSCSHLSLVTAPGPHSNPGSATDVWRWVWRAREGELKWKLCVNKEHKLPVCFGFEKKVKKSPSSYSLFAMTSQSKKKKTKIRHHLIWIVREHIRNAPRRIWKRLTATIRVSLWSQDCHTFISRTVLDSVVFGVDDNKFAIVNDFRRLQASTTNRKAQEFRLLP